MKTRGTLFKLGIAVGLLGLQTACGLEGILVDALTDEPVVVEEEVVDAVEGQLVLTVLDGMDLSGVVYGPPTISLFDGDGALLLDGLTPELQGESLLLPIDDTMAGGARRVVVQSGTVVLKAIICVRADDVPAGITAEVSIKSTAASLVVEALGAFHGGSLDGYSLYPYSLVPWTGEELMRVYQYVMDGIDTGLESSDPETYTSARYDFYRMVEALVMSGDQAGTGATMFPLAVTARALLDPDFLADTLVDYDGDGVDDADPSTFDQAGFGIAEDAVTAISSETEPLVVDGLEYIRTIFAVHTAGDIENGNCTATDLCTSGKIVCDEGDTMFFTGGIHEDSEVVMDDATTAAVNASLGAWVPNESFMEMFDDGVNGGDEVAGDGVYTITLLLPVGLRIGYKYTYGLSGQSWTGTEEWPGNQRLMEMVDVNGDGYVLRHDVITDEATNKDKYNCYGGCSSSNVLAWDQDLNGDGWIEARETPPAVEIIDPVNGVVVLTGQCTAEAADLQFVAPSGTTKAVVNDCQ